MNDLKVFPSDYPDEIVKIVTAISLPEYTPTIVGSMSKRNQLYAADYDCIQDITSNDYHALATQLKTMVKRLMNYPNLYIGDIKMGSIQKWKIINDKAHITNGEVVGYYALQSRNKLRWLLENKIITSKIYDDISKLLVNNTSIQQFLTLQSLDKFHIVRWKPKDVLNGFVILPDKSQYSLVDAIQSNSIHKLDVIAYTQNSKYTDFSMIYKFPNDVLLPRSHSIREDVINFLLNKKYYKMAKRMLAIAKSKHDERVLTALFNSNVGILYSIASDISTMLFIVEHVKHIPSERLSFEINNFKYKLSNISQLRKFYGVDDTINDIVDSLSTPNISAVKYNRKLNELSSIINDLISYYTKQYLTKNKLFPPVNYLP